MARATGPKVSSRVQFSGGPEYQSRLKWWPKSGELTLVGDPAEVSASHASLQRLLAGASSGQAPVLWSFSPLPPNAMRAGGPERGLAWRWSWREVSLQASGRLLAVHRRDGAVLEGPASSGAVWVIEESLE